jgi:hypothetical protein
MLDGVRRAELAFGARDAALDPPSAPRGDDDGGKRLSLCTRASSEKPDSAPFMNIKRYQRKKKKKKDT